MSNSQKIIAILLDKRARWDERDDAAMYLAEFDDLESYNALVAVASDLSEDEVILSSCGESIAIRWKKNNGFDQKIFNRMAPNAKNEIKGLLGI